MTEKEILREAITEIAIWNPESECAAYGMIECAKEAIKALADTEVADTGGKKKEDKFIVINRKRFDEFSATDKLCDSRITKEAIHKVEKAVEDFRDHYEFMTEKKMDQKYIVCNQDEPYAEKVWDLILGRLKDGE